MADSGDAAQTPAGQGELTQPHQDGQIRRDGQNKQDGQDALNPLQLLADLRSDGVRAPAARSILAFHPDDSGTDALRVEVARLLVASVRPSDHALVRWLLEQETLRQRAVGTEGSEILYALVAALARFAQPEDALSIWRAREATDETRVGVDVEQVGRLGVDAVRRFLRSMIDAGIDAGGPEAGAAARAMAWLEDGLAAGAFAI